MDWADEERPTHLRSQPDTGIDVVAENPEGGMTAIQCKFYKPHHRVSKRDLDSFLAASGREPFTKRLIVTTSYNWGKNAEAVMTAQTTPVQRLSLTDLEELTVDWANVKLHPVHVPVKNRKKLRPHQRDAFAAVKEGFTRHDRGRLIMACGTGKTLTSLRVAEDLAGRNGSVLFLVPSISLLSQSLKEWTAQAEIPIRPFAVCSDTKAGRRTQNEDAAPYELVIPPTTDSGKLASSETGTRRPGEMTVVFSTYQSLQVIYDAQQNGFPEFDFVVCDEAHRTTGVNLSDKDESNFVRIHDSNYIKAKQRLYMTATPRVYVEASKKKARDAGAEVVSMDDEDLYGPEFHRLSFGEAVKRELLSDYKVLLLTVPENLIPKEERDKFSKAYSRFTNKVQAGKVGNKTKEVFDKDDVVKIVGCINALAKSPNPGSGFKYEDEPMRRAVAFANTIEKSKKSSYLLKEIAESLAEKHVNDDTARFSRNFSCEAQHVDGKTNALKRSEKLDWLKEQPPVNECRILSNARCLNEGVDVPALDAVLFLQPRKSQVDVVQAVGRVMRKAEGKDYGYVILPIAITPEEEPETALNNNDRYKVVWQVLQALRSHDETFNALINKIDLNNERPAKIQVIGIGNSSGDSNESADNGEKCSLGTIFQPQLFPMEEWSNAIYARIVARVGSRRYWEDWTGDMAEIAERHEEKIYALLEGSSIGLEERFEEFLNGLRVNLNDSVTREAAVGMLSQHLITMPIFEALFGNQEFTKRNPVSQVMERMLKSLDRESLEAETAKLDKFYNQIIERVDGIDNFAGKQKIISELYEGFFRKALPKVASSLGIVYTPIEIVDFIISSVEHLLNTEFKTSLTNKGVHILDPFTGAGTFITRLLQSGHIKSDDLLRKYSSEIHANEIILLAYYIAAINIEMALRELQHTECEPFKGLVLADTFQSSEHTNSRDNQNAPLSPALEFGENNERVDRQMALDIRVILGNPPYSVGKKSENDDNENLSYPVLDSIIKSTYLTEASTGLKRNLYDSYIRAFRWASTRVLNSEQGGIVAFVSNGGYIDGKAFDGFRKRIAKEFDIIYCYNLRGNQRTAGEASKKEGGKLFGEGSRTQTAVSLLVRLPGKQRPPVKVFYRDIGDYHSRETKLNILGNEKSVADIEWKQIIPDRYGDWINQRSSTYQKLTPISHEKGTSLHKNTGFPIFAASSTGCITSRDAWMVNFSRRKLEQNVIRTIDHYNSQVEQFRRVPIEKHEGFDPNDSILSQVEKLIDKDPAKFSWCNKTFKLLARCKEIDFRPEALVKASFSPFTRTELYFDKDLNTNTGKLPKIFPTRDSKNIGIYCTLRGKRTPFAALAVDAIPNFSVFSPDPGCLFPKYTYERAALTPPPPPRFNSFPG